MAVDPQSAALLRQMFGLDPLGGGGNPLTGSSLDDPLQTFMAPALDPRSLMASQADASGAPNPPTYPEFAAAQDRLRAMRANTPNTSDRVDPSAAAYNAQVKAQNDAIAAASPDQLDMSTGGMDMSGAPPRDRMDMMRGAKAAQDYASANQDPGMMSRLMDSLSSSPLGLLGRSAANAAGNSLPGNLSAPSVGGMARSALNAGTSPVLGGINSLGELINSLMSSQQASAAPTPTPGGASPVPVSQQDASLMDQSGMGALAQARLALQPGGGASAAPGGSGLMNTIGSAISDASGAASNFLRAAPGALRDAAGAAPSAFAAAPGAIRDLVQSLGGQAVSAFGGGAPGAPTGGGAPGAPTGSLVRGGSSAPLGLPGGASMGGATPLTAAGGALANMQNIVAAARGAPQLPPQTAAAVKALTAGGGAPAAAQAYNAPGAPGAAGPQGDAFTQRMNAPLNAPQPVSARPATIITPTAVAAAGAAGGAVRAPPPAAPAGAAGSYPAQTAPTRLPATPAAAVAATTPTPPKPDPQGPMAGSAPASAVAAVENHGFKLPSGTWDALIAFGASAMAHADKPGLMPFGEALQDASKAMTAQDAAKFDHGIKLMTLQAQISEANAKLAEAASNHLMTSDDRKMHYAAMQQNAQLMASVHLQLGQAGLDIKQGQLALQQNQQVINQQSADAKTAEANAAAGRQYDEAIKAARANITASAGTTVGMNPQALEARANMLIAPNFPNNPAVLQAQKVVADFDASSRAAATGPQARDLTAINKLRADYGLSALTPVAPPAR